MGNAACAPLVSVVVPAYQQPEFLNEALESVRRQSFTDWEIIVVDDASGEEFVRRYVLPERSRLIVHKKRSGCAAATRNTGIRAARGKYIAFLDQDDIWLPDKLSVQVPALEARPDAAVAFCHCLLVDERLQPLPKQQPPMRSLGDPLREMLRHCFIKTPSTALVRREALEECGLCDESIVGASDWDLWIRIALRHEFIPVPATLVWYRTHQDMQTKQGDIMVVNRMKVCEKTLRWLEHERPECVPILRRRYNRILRRLGELRLKEGKFDEAVAAFRRAVQMRPWHLSTRLALCRAERAARRRFREGDVSH